MCTVFQERNAIFHNPSVFNNPVSHWNFCHNVWHKKTVGLPVVKNCMIHSAISTIYVRDGQMDEQTDIDILSNSVHSKLFEIQHQ